MDQLFAGIRLAVFLGTSGAIFALGFAVVCKWLKWAPINVTIHTHVHKGEDAPAPEGR